MEAKISILCRTAIVWICLILAAIEAPAAEDQIARDFGPLAGYVVMKENDEFIIDLDAGHGIQFGDIFTVVGAGREIVHPVNKKVLGQLETVKGVLKVTRTADGYSFARALSGLPAIKRGDAIRRYALLTAIFWDYSGTGRPVYTKLQQMLPQLKWREYHLAQQQRPSQPKPIADTADALTFIFHRDELVVRDPEFNELHRYPLGSASTPPKKTPPAPLAAAPAAPILKSTARSPVVMPEYQQVQQIAQLPKTSMMADFVFVDQNLLLASTDGAAIEIFKLTHQLEPVAVGRLPRPARVLAVKWWIPTSPGKPHLAVTTWEDNAVVGLIFRLDGDRLSPLPLRLSRILGAFDLDADGLPETLLGQNFVGETFFGERIRALQLAGDNIRTGSLEIKLPRQFPVLGSLLADLTSDGQLENAFIRNGNLYIFNGKRQLYKSAKKMGGTLSFLTYDVDPSFQEPKTTTAFLEVSPVIVDFDADGQNELIASSSERSILGSLRITPGLNKTWISIFKYDSGRFTTGKLGGELELALQGITLDKQRLLVVGTEQGQGAKSYLLAYSLAP